MSKRTRFLTLWCDGWSCEFCEYVLWEISVWSHFEILPAGFFKTNHPMLRSQWWSNQDFSTQNQHGLSFLLKLQLMIGLALILYPLFVFSHQSFNDENAHVMCVFFIGAFRGLLVLQLLHGVANSICQQLNSRNIAQIAEYEFRPKHKP